MGNLQIKFLSNGEKVEELDDDFKISKMQKFQKRYNTQKMNEIKLEGNDWPIKLEIDNLGKEIEWSKQNYPDEEIKQKVLEIAYYSEISNQLKEVIGEIEKCTFEDGHKLKRLGKKAIHEIENTRNSKFHNIEPDKVIATDKIKSTLDKDVDNLVDYAEKNYSNKRKIKKLNKVINELTNDVNLFKIPIDSINYNNEK